MGPWGRLSSWEHESEKEARGVRGRAACFARSLQGSESERVPHQRARKHRLLPQLSPVTYTFFLPIVNPFR